MYTAITELSTLSLHDALPILFDGIWAAREQSRGQSTTMWEDTMRLRRRQLAGLLLASPFTTAGLARAQDDEALAYYLDRKSTRLNSSHVEISYAVFCLKK